DLYVLTNWQNSYSQNKARPKVKDGSSASNDRFYRNEGIGSNGHPVFRDVTKEAGITIEGHGLGIAISDINLDGWPDIYVANDFLTNDLLWINNQDGTFSNKAGEYTRHQTYNGMGTDVNDFNNDGLPDIVVLDMLPETNFRKKTMITPMNYDRFLLNLSYDYESQYVRNTLQLHNGVDANGSVSFSEIGQLAGIHSTDWSWAPLFADYDHDGMKDLWITNGYRKDVTDLDYIVYLSQNITFSGEKLNQDELKKLSAELQSVHKSNFMFKNNGDLTFSDVTEEWGVKRPSYSNGAAFADFDNDGDLDLVVNNIDAEAFLYRNNLNPAQDSTKSYFRVNLVGTRQNRQGFGAKVIVRANGEKIYHDHSTYRGYKSTVENTIHFGLGKVEQVDTLEVYWLDGSVQILTDLAVNQEITVNHAEAQKTEDYIDVRETLTDQVIYQDITRQAGIDYVHKEPKFIDFKFEPLLPRMFSQAGPAVAVGDINGDELDDFIVGGGVREPMQIFLQTAEGQFQRKAFDQDLISENLGLNLLDIDNDGDLDLYAVSGSVEFYAEHPAYQDHLYLNDGKGNFSNAQDKIPAASHSGSCVTAADFDQDGDLDIFVGGKIVPRSYPNNAPSMLLENNNGEFTNVIEKVAPDLENAGMINSAIWTDFDNDGWIDLIVVGEWMPISFFKNNQGKLINITEQAGMQETSGWWNSIIGEDFDQDGDIDYVAGNYGLNNEYKPSAEQPLRVYINDFDENGKQDAIMTYYIQGEEYTVNVRDALIDQMNSFKAQFKDYTSFASAKFSEIFPADKIEAAEKKEVFTFYTSYIENQGDNTFKIKAMPVRAQFAPVYGMQSGDFNQDGFTDLLMVGNSYAEESIQGWQDAFDGALFAGDGQGNFSYMPLSESGFRVDSDAKAMANIRIGNSMAELISSNQGPLRLTGNSLNAKQPIVKLNADEYAAIITLQDGSKYKKEFYYGHGYLSQNSRYISLPGNVASVEFINYIGKKRTWKPEMVM
ncbi:MAG: VCBS repeat-containing protein, partial [Cyclobacteriaceae bacterium]